MAPLGYNVISIQHDLSADQPLPRNGNLFERRKPHWEKGVQNILFIVNTLKKSEKYLNLNKIILVSHSNGGDISMMFAEKNPNIVSKIISLDSLRYPFPLNIPVLHFGASDTIAKKGVIPQKTTTIFIKGAKHIDLCDRGTARVKKEIHNSLTIFLK